MHATHACLHEVLPNACMPPSILGSSLAPAGSFTFGKKTGLHLPEKMPVAKFTVNRGSVAHQWHEQGMLGQVNLVIFVGAFVSHGLHGP